VLKSPAIGCRLKKSANESGAGPDLAPLLA
jgi:hypothetical protein